MKMFLIIAACFAFVLATPNTEYKHSSYSIEEIVKQLKGQPHKPYSGAVTPAYFIPVPSNLEVEAYVHYETDKQKWYYQLLKYGYVPVFNYYSQLVGFYTETSENKEELTNVFSYDKNFILLGLTTVSNNEEQVVAIFK